MQGKLHGVKLAPRSGLVLANVIRAARGESTRFSAGGDMASR